MKIERLIKMANDISSFFACEPDRSVAIAGIRHHISRTWEPRMRKEIIEYYQQDGAELSALAKEAVSQL